MIFQQIYIFFMLFIILNKQCVDFFQWPTLTRNIEFPVDFILSLTSDSENGDFFTQEYIFRNINIGFKINLVCERKTTRIHF